MNHPWLKGVWVAMPTPFSAPGRIDAGVVVELLRRYKAAGLHGAYTTGTDGEMHVLDQPEFQALVDAFARGAEETGLPVQVGCTWSHTDGVIERARYARTKGINRVQIALPSWVPLNDREILTFFAAIQDALPDVTLTHYNIARSGRFLTGRDYRAILDVCPNLAGSKHTGGDVGSLIEIVQATPELNHFVVDSQIVPGALFGAKGFYSFVANLSPAFALRLWRTCQEGRWEEAARLHATSNAFFREWLATCPEISASPALAKIATRAGIFPDLPPTVRAPYQAGEQRHVDELKTLIAERFPALAWNPNLSAEEQQ
jgi:dihydrodipicolinate synthase/N-acetylneuraminate lyase